MKYLSWFVIMALMISCETGTEDTGNESIESEDRVSETSDENIEAEALDDLIEVPEDLLGVFNSTIVPTEPTIYLTLEQGGAISLVSEDPSGVRQAQYYTYAAAGNISEIEVLNKSKKGNFVYNVTIKWKPLEKEITGATQNGEKVASDSEELQNFSPPLTEKIFMAGSYDEEGKLNRTFSIEAEKPLISNLTGKMVYGIKDFIGQSQ